MSDFQRWFRVLAAATVLLYLVAIALGVYVLVTTSHTRHALCTFHDDLERRADQTKRYLDEHPGPVPFPGITRGSLELSLANQERAVRALADLNCG